MCVTENVIIFIILKVSSFGPPPPFCCCEEEKKGTPLLIPLSFSFFVEDDANAGNHTTKRITCSPSLYAPSLSLIQCNTGTNRLGEGVEGSEFIRANGSQGEMKYKWNPKSLVASLESQCGDEKTWVCV